MKKLTFLSGIIFLLFCSISLASCSNDKDGATIIDEKSNTVLQKQDTPLDSIIVSLVTDKSLQSPAIDITYHVSTQDIALEFHRVADSKSFTNTRSTNVKWHYAGHARNAYEAVNVARNIENKCKGANTIDIHLTKTKDGGHDVYWKKS